MPGSTRPPSTSSTSAPVTGTTMDPTTTIKEETTVSTTEAGTTATGPVTTTSQIVTTSLGSTHGPGPSGLPKYVVGMYILLADDTEDGFHTDSDWNPLLHKYQQEGANVLFFTFINPASMEVPLSFKKLAASRGTGAEGSVPTDTRIIFAVGGYAYSLNPNPWEWLTSREAAESMAEKVAAWRDLYGIDGVDLDIEEGAGSRGEAGPNLVHFIRKLKSLLPAFLVTQPTYGYPQVQAEIDVINAVCEELCRRLVAMGRFSHQGGCAQKPDLAGQQRLLWVWHNQHSCPRDRQPRSFRHHGLVLQRKRWPCLWKRMGLLRLE